MSTSTSLTALDRTSSAATYVSLALALLQTVLASTGTGAVGSVAFEVAAEIQGAVTHLLAVHGSDVSYQQLEGLRVKLPWATPSMP